MRQNGRFWPKKWNLAGKAVFGRKSGFWPFGGSFGQFWPRNRYLAIVEPTEVYYIANEDFGQQWLFGLKIIIDRR